MKKNNIDKIKPSNSMSEDSTIADVSITKSVDKLLTAVPGNWKFDENISAGFDDHVRKSVPFYDEIQKQILSISQWFVNEKTGVCDIGCSTGETLKNLAKYHIQKKDVHFYGIETSSSMIKEAKKKCKDVANIDFIHMDALNYKSFDNINFILAVFVLQFIPLENRKKLLKKIYDEMPSGASIFIAEKIIADKGLFEDIWLEIYWDLKKHHGLNADEVISKAESLRGVLTPLTLDENIQMLKDCGFRHIEVPFKWCNFATLLAVKI